MNCPHCAATLINFGEVINKEVKEESIVEEVKEENNSKYSFEMKIDSVITIKR